MTLQSPRIYIYKITFEEVLYYYYGVHKEKKFDEYYMGSPQTHKWCWELYTPKKQILEIFPYTDEGWIEAQEVETRLIKPVYNTDKWCLNESCGGRFSLDVNRKTGKKLLEQKIGIFSFTEEQRKENSKKAGKKVYELGLGIHSMTKEERSNVGKRAGKIGGAKTRDEKLGIFAMTKEQKTELAKKLYAEGKGMASLTSEQRSAIGKKSKEEGKGIFSLTLEQRSAIGKKLKEEGKGIFSLTLEQRKENLNKAIIIAAEKCSREFILISPEGEVIKGKNVRRFCRKFNLNDSAILRVLKGTQSHHKGWKKYISDNITVLDFL